MADTWSGAQEGIQKEEKKKEVKEKDGEEEREWEVGATAAASKRVTWRSG